MVNIEILEYTKVWQHTGSYRKYSSQNKGKGKKKKKEGKEKIQELVSRPEWERTRKQAV